MNKIKVKIRLFIIIKQIIIFKIKYKSMRGSGFGG